MEGENFALDRFLDELSQKPPSLARIDDLRWSSKAEQGELGFTIEPSVFDAAEPVAISPDITTCGKCLEELVDPKDRRFGYALLNCTHCGPRLTITTAAPTIVRGPRWLRLPCARLVAANMRIRPIGGFMLSRLRVRSVVRDWSRLTPRECESTPIARSNTRRSRCVVA